MADLPSHPDTHDEQAVGHDRGSTSGKPRRRFMVAVVIGVALVAVMVVLHLSGVVGPAGQ